MLISRTLFHRELNSHFLKIPDPNIYCVTCFDDLFAKVFSLYFDYFFILHQLCFFACFFDYDNSPLIFVSLRNAKNAIYQSLERL